MMPYIFLLNASAVTLSDYLCMDAHTNYSVVCLINFFLSRLAGVLELIPEMHQHNTCMCASKEQHGDKSYCGTRISNNVFDNLDSNCAIGSFQKRIPSCFLLLFSNYDFYTIQLHLMY